MANQQANFLGPQSNSTLQDTSSESPEPEDIYLPTPSLLRIKKDIVEFFADPPPGIFISPEVNDITQIHALVIGPDGTPYEGGFFRFHIRFPTDYPMASPQVKFLTTDAGRVTFNPNLYASGKVCLSILGTWSGPPWSPAQSLSSLLISIQSLMNEEPFYNEPGFARGNYGEEAKMYNVVIKHETTRVAVCDAIEECLQDRASFPPALKQVVLTAFTENYGKYEDAVKACLHLSGTAMTASMFVPTSSKFQYEVLLTRLQDLRARVDKLNEAAAPAEIA